MLKLIVSNRAEVLADALAEELRTRPLPLLEPEIVLVPASGTARWLQLRLAERLGIVCQTRFPLPAAYVWSLFASVLPQVPRNSPFATDTLVWRLFQLLGTLPDEPAFAPVRRYLAAGGSAQRHGLAAKLAASFDRYLAWRPDWVAAWLRGEQRGLGGDEAWQLRLWQMLAAELPDLPQRHPQADFLAALANDAGLREKLPKRLSLFGADALPPLYLDLFARLGESIDVHLYLENPSREYWGQIVRSRTVIRAALDDSVAAGCLDSGNRLFASLAQAGRIFFDRSNELLAHESDECFVAAYADNMLGSLQRDILDLREPASASEPGCDDDSLQVHVCHGAMREIEVLHDRLLDWFERDATLQPADILVLAPDIDAYAPAIEAVFAAMPMANSGSTRRIPFAIADWQGATTGDLKRSFDRLLDLGDGDLAAEQVLAALEAPALLQRWDFSEGDFALLRGWVRASEIRWGRDGAMRAERGLPADDAHTWKSGLERLLLGYALPGDGHRLFNDVLPYAYLDAGNARLLGRFLECLEALFAFVAELRGENSLAQWCARLTRGFATFLIADDDRTGADQLEAETLRSALARLAANADDVACSDPVPLKVLREHFDAALASRAPGHAFLGGGVTFAALRLYRPVPARIVCLIGMNDGVFPRNPPSPGFDLIQAHPRAGDRQPRDDDRYALLQALLAARERFYVSYTGRDIRNDAVLPPAAPVDELLDAVHRACGTAALQQVVTEHPLQPFSPRYCFAETRLFTYAEVGTVAPYTPSPFLAVPLQVDSQTDLQTELDAVLHDWLNITPDDLIRFLQHPVRFLLRQRLGIELRESEALIEANEPFLIDPRDNWRFDKVIFDDLLGGADFTTSLRLAQARGALPHGAAGAAIFTTHWPALEALAAKVAAARCGEPLPAPLVEFSAHGVRLAGRLDTVFENGIVLARPGRQRAQEVLDLWVRHLLLNLAAPPACACRSRLLTLDDDISLRPLAAAEPLAVLLGIYRRGLCELLPLPPKTAWKYAQAAHKGSDSTAWLGEWQGSEFKHGECQDVWLDLAFRDVDLFAGELGERFRQLAMQIFAPVLEASA